jgi:hypothetical protein
MVDDDPYCTTLVLRLRHPEVAAKPPSKDERLPIGPSSCEARFARTSG